MSATQPIREPELLQKFKDYYCSSYPNIRNYTLCVMGLNTALRITDILNLKWENIYNFRTGKFLIHLTVIEKKTQKTNMIALNEALRETLSLYFETTVPSAEQYLFVSRNGINQPLSRSQAFRIIKKLRFLQECFRISVVIPCEKPLDIMPGSREFRLFF